MKQTIVVAAVLAALYAAPVRAQTSHDHQAQQGAQHGQPAAPAQPPGGMQGMRGGMGMHGGGTQGMQGGGMMQMHAMHHALPGGVQFVEGRLAFLKTELKITDAQMPQWEQFASSYRVVGKAMGEGHRRMMQGGMNATLPERLDAEEKKLTGHLDAIRTLKHGLMPLYGVLSEEQKKLADGFLHHPLGRM
jgi:hypothetical protein